MRGAENSETDFGYNSNNFYSCGERKSILEWKKGQTPMQMDYKHSRQDYTIF